MSTTDALEAELRPLYERADVRTSEVVEALLRAYALDTGERLEPDKLDLAARERLRLYLMDPAHDRTFHLFHRGPVRRHLPLFADMGGKLSWLSQVPCAVCPSSVQVGHFPIDISPWSRQSRSGKWVGPALRQAIETTEPYASRYAGRPPLGNPLCVRIVFVLEGGATMKDCDNMAKGLLDALQGLIYVDDRQIEHLDVVKIRDSSPASGYILVRYATTSVNIHDDVIHPLHATIAWLTAPTLDIGRFRPPVGRN
jgi:hypothetical protein